MTWLNSQGKERCWLILASFQQFLFLVFFLHFFWVSKNKKIKGKILTEKLTIFSSLCAFSQTSHGGLVHPNGAGGAGGEWVLLHRSQNANFSLLHFRCSAWWWCQQNNSRNTAAHAAICQRHKQQWDFSSRNHCRFGAPQQRCCTERFFQSPEQ